jgi:hypothetical protein
MSGEGGLCTSCCLRLGPLPDVGLAAMNGAAAAVGYLGASLPSTFACWLAELARVDS